MSSLKRTKEWPFTQFRSRLPDEDDSDKKVDVRRQET